MDGTVCGRPDKVFEDNHTESESDSGITRGIIMKMDEYEKELMELEEKGYGWLAA